MKIPLFESISRLAALACLASAMNPTATYAADADAAALLARARAFLGGDAALGAVNSLHFLGAATSGEGTVRQIEIMVRRPLQQCIIESAGDVRAITGLNDYAGWRRIEHASRPDAERVALLSAPDVRRLRANTWQNLYFYQHLDAVGGQVVIEGDAEIDGVPCVKAVFTHTGGITFVRYFERATGRLVMTRTDDGAETRERGAFPVAGVRFPKELTTTTLDGKSSTVVFDEIRVNEEFADTLFETPRPQFNFAKKEPADVAPPAATPVATTP